MGAIPRYSTSTSPAVLGPIPRYLQQQSLFFSQFFAWRSRFGGNIRAEYAQYANTLYVRGLRDEPVGHGSWTKAHGVWVPSPANHDEARALRRVQVDLPAIPFTHEIESCALRSDSGVQRIGPELFVVRDVAYRGYSEVPTEREPESTPWVEIGKNQFLTMREMSRQEVAA